MNEIWKDINGYEGLYQVSNLGRVKRLRKQVNYRHGKRFINEKIMKIKNNGNGYMLVSLTKQKIPKNKYVHRLVAESFIPNLNNKKYINHLDGIKSNNTLENLEWCTQSDNNIHAYKMGLRFPSGACTPGSFDHKRKAVCKYSLNGDLITEYPSVMDASIKNRVNSSRISRVCNGIGISVHGFIYKFKS